MDALPEIEQLRAALASERARVAELEACVAQLSKQLAKALEHLGQNSSNSNKPPSSDPPNAKQAKKKTKGRHRGGQKGHRGSRRELLPPEQVDEVVDLFPAECESCWKPLRQSPDKFAKRYQLTDLKPLALHTTEWRRHAVVCPCCGYKTRAKYDPDVISRLSFGPKLMAVVALLTGVYHLSRRQTVRLLRELLGVRMSLGSVSAIERRVGEAVEPAVDEAMESARAAPVKHADGTTWLRSGTLLSLWVVATTSVTVFRVLPNGQKATLRDDFFGRVYGILVSDRATALNFWAMHRRQVCWAHLVRKLPPSMDGGAVLRGRQVRDGARQDHESHPAHRPGAAARCAAAHHAGDAGEDPGRAPPAERAMDQPAAVGQGLAGANRRPAGRVAHGAAGRDRDQLGAAGSTRHGSQPETALAEGRSAHGNRPGMGLASARSSLTDHAWDRRCQATSDLRRPS